MLKGTQRIYVFFGIVYAVFFLTIGYLLFLTPGLEFEQIGNGSAMKLFLKNSSLQSIKDINVFTKEGIVFMQIEELLPNERMEVKTDSLPNNASLIYAAAEYHAIVSKNLGNTAIGESKFTYELAYPGFLQNKMEFSIFLNLCNTGADAAVVVEESHDSKFFTEKTQIQNADIDSEKCSKFEFKFNPVKSGKTEIFFNIKSVSFNQTIAKELEIVD